MRISVKRWSEYLRIFYCLLWADIAALIHDFKGDFVDACVWMFCDVSFCAYVMPLMGLPSWYGLFVGASVANNQGLFDCYNSISGLVADYEGDRVLLFPLSLPIPAWMVFFKVALVRAIRTMCIVLLLLPLLFILLYTKLGAMKLSPFKFLFASWNILLLSGLFSVWASSIPKNSSTVGRVTTRILLPLWVFGGTWASWKVFNSAMPFLGKLLLLNPFLHGSESLRAAVMGQAGYLPYWSSVLAIIGFSVLFCVWGVWRLKKRLDFV
ncbi:hypothetical protein ACFLY6_03420 [Candidatus Dependentiae bacterium]